MGLPFRLLTDFPNLNTIRDYDVENQIGKSITVKRAHVILDEKRILRFKTIMHPFDREAPFLPNQGLLDKLEKIYSKRIK